MMLTVGSAAGSTGIPENGRLAPCGVELASTHPEPREAQSGRRELTGQRRAVTEVLRAGVVAHALGGATEKREVVRLAGMRLGVGAPALASTTPPEASPEPRRSGGCQTKDASRFLA